MPFSRSLGQVPCSVSIQGALVAAGVALGNLSTPVALAQSAPHWSYGGSHNPTRWGSLTEDYKLCGEGRDQSPINLTQAHTETLRPLQFEYQPTPLEIVNNGHSIQVNYAPGSQAMLNGQSYNLLQFHFHTPSEHQINGESAAMELHLVHDDGAGKLAVVAVMLDEGESSELIEQLWENIPPIGETQKVPQVMVDIAELLPQNSSYFNYVGSLTTPPCSEGVMWYVLTEPMEVSEEQIETFQTLYTTNARPVQPTNGRSIGLRGR